MALTQDVHIVRYGAPGNADQPLNFGMRASPVEVFRGSIALTDSSGFLKNSSSPLSTDTCWGLIDRVTPTGTVIDGGPGITGGTADGGVLVEIATGSFYLASGTGADALTAGNVGATVYVINETTVGATNGTNTRPKAGTMIAYDSTNAPITALGPIVVKMGVGGP